ncbi:phenylalanyl-tRNA synthetase beta chain [Azospirillaceae bacterium]
MISAVPPSWRGEFTAEADLVEEILRLRGFDNIPTEPLPRVASLTRPALTPRRRRIGLVRRVLAARGLNEAVSWSFMSSALAERFGAVPTELRLINPISAELDVMRPSILGNLIQAAGRNADRGHPDLGLFEIGPTYRGAKPEDQDMVAAGIRAGTALPRHWSTGAARAETLTTPRDALATLEAAGAPTANLQITSDAPNWYHPGRSGVLRLGPTILGRFGEIHPDLLEAVGVKGPVVGFEILLDAAPQPKKKTGTARPMLKLAPFQPVVRDFAFVVDQAVEADRILRAAKNADKNLIKDVSVFDVYQGPGVDSGKKSVAINITLQPIEKL